MAFGANFILANFNSGPPNVGAPAAVAPSNMTTLELERDDTPPCADTEEDSCMLKRILLWLWCYHSKTTYRSTLLRGAFSSTRCHCRPSPLSSSSPPIAIVVAVTIIVNFVTRRPPRRCHRRCRRSSSSPPSLSYPVARHAVAIVIVAIVIAPRCRRLLPSSSSFYPEPIQYDTQECHFVPVRT